MTKNEVIQKMIDGQRTHVRWAAKQRELMVSGSNEIPIVGNAEHHDEWIKTYNWALYYLLGGSKYG